MANEDYEAEMKINLSALKKIDGDIEEIIDTASSVAHYKFLSSSGKWDKTEVEGSLFLYSRSSSPLVILFIMNRLNKENTRLPLTHDMEFKIQKPFILCKSADSEIIGIWFYDLDECERFGALLKRLAMLAKDDRSLKMAIMMERKKQKEQSSDNSVNSSKKSILDMFNRAQLDYDKNHGMSIARKSPANSPNQNKQMKSKAFKGAKGKSEPNLKAMLTNINEEKPMANDIVWKLQQAAKEKKQLDELANQNYTSQFTDAEQHRKKFRTRTISSSSEMDSLYHHKHNEEFSSRAGDLAIFNNLSLVNINNSGPAPKQKVIGCAELESKLLSEQNSNDTLTRHIKRSVSFDSVNQSLVPQEPEFKVSNGVVSSMKTSSNVTLLSPSSLKGKTGKGRGAVLNTLMSQQKVAIAANFNNQTGNTPKLNPKKLFPEDTTVDVTHESNNLQLNSLLSPAAFLRTNSMKQTDDELTLNANSKAILSKEQFQEALVHLIKTNKSFSTALYDAYLESSNS